MEQLKQMRTAHDTSLKLRSCKKNRRLYGLYPMELLSQLDADLKAKIRYSSGGLLKKMIAAARIMYCGLIDHCSRQALYKWYREWQPACTQLRRR